MIKPLIALVFLSTNFYVYHWFARSEYIPPRETFAGFPLEFAGGWLCPKKSTMDAETLENLGATDYLLCEYERSDPAGLVGVYVGYHASQVREEGGGSAENSIHPPKHCLPGSGWDIIAHEVVELDLPGLPQRPAPVNRLVIARGEQRQLVYYWYQTQGRVIASDWRKIVYLSWDRARRQRTDGALVRFTAPIVKGTDTTADESILALAREMMPRLSAYIPE